MGNYPQKDETATEVEEVPSEVSGQVLIKSNTFMPETMTVKVGEVVTWVNNESYGHDVVSDDGTYRSPKMATGEKYSFTFTKEGTSTYICGIHPFMKATIVVTK